MNPDQQEQVLTLFRTTQLSTKEIAEIVSVPEWIVVDFLVQQQAIRRVSSSTEQQP